MVSVQTIGVGAAILSAAFWGLGAGIRIPSISLWRWGAEDPTTSALRRQSLMNAFAAVCAAVAAICQAYLIYSVPL